MERSSDHGAVATALAEVRPAPREDFARELDERVAAGFPRPRLRRTPLGGLVDRVRATPSHRLGFAGATAALAAIAIATVVIASGGSRHERLAVALDHSSVHRISGVEAEALSKTRGAQAFNGAARAAGGGGGPASANAEAVSPTLDHVTDQSLPRLQPYSRHRDIERSAEIGLLADPTDVAGDSAAVFAAVHDARGIVLHSTTTAGKHAGARFDLLIPSARLGDALAAFSAIDEVGTRHDATDDITAPTVATGERLRDSRARIDALLARLSSAETEAEMAAIEAELARERRHAARLRTQLQKLERRTEFSRVSVRIETGDSSGGSGGAWGIDDAFGDAGHILGIAAGVTLVGLAVLAPLALICLLAWLGRQTWITAQRKRALRNA